MTEYKRSRILFEATHQAHKSTMTNQDAELVDRALCLNEVFTAEKDVGSASRFRVRQDNVDCGVFKSSGLLISTGTGSTGWLYSARQMSPDKIRRL